MSPLFKRARREQSDAAAAEEATTELPAGVDPAELSEARPTARRRGRLRKRLRHLRRTREFLLRDLGGFTYELHRSGATGSTTEALRAEKIARLEALDAEVHDLEGRLEDTTGELLLREPGIGGFCPRCGELHGSDARYCSACGGRLDPRASTVAPERPTGRASEDAPTQEAEIARPEQQPDPAEPR